MSNINPQGSRYPVPLAFAAPYKFILIWLQDGKGEEPPEISKILAPVGTANMQRKVGYLVTWAAAYGLTVHISPMTSSQATYMLPDGVTFLPRRNFIILTPGTAALLAYKAYLSGGIDIPVKITQTDHMN